MYGCTSAHMWIRNMEFIKKKNAKYAETTETKFLSAGSRIFKNML
jgi:hypothetical protein